MPNDRFPPPPPSLHTPQQASALASATTAIHAAYGPNAPILITDASGALQGPFSILLHTPSTFEPYVHFASAVVTLPNLSARERELVALACVSVTRAPYVRYAHRRIGVGVGLSEGQVREAGEGRVPGGLGGEREEVVFEVGLGMGRGFGRVAEEEWGRGVRVLGVEGMSAVAQVVGVFLLASCFDNVRGREVVEG
ncbi:hypothetical protein EJ04DRAFT_578570 [Polyplosphaeria fusca]|uniref:Carboxymuconolactone decarboxylase-like domain-containing protein n=1 Tax=Polyplosphaeria fusca TaxID=682080 RepID=A0A9P4QV40_9PLEO|nr:hypothetical protein EJ04DRAFT_578570 [Polyplosphaeria fusca]